MGEKKINVLMCGSDLSVCGGMVSVIKNYLNYSKWGVYNIIYIPTHIEKNKLVALVYFVQAYIRILIRLLKGEFQIAYFHTAERGSFFRKAILVRTLRKFGIKTVMHHHAAEFENFYAGLSSKKKKFVSDTLEMVDLNIVLSNGLIAMITEKAPHAKIKVLYNAVETYEFNQYSEGAHNILFLGRLGERKGIYDLLKVIKKIDERLPQEVQFYLCGDGDIGDVQKKVAEYGIGHRIAHIGWIDGKQKTTYIANSMLNVLPSYNEGLPMSILETMACGIPNISTYIASIPEVIRDGENGFMIVPGDLDKLSENIMMLVDDDELRLRISHQAWQDVTSEFALDKHISKLKSYLAHI